MRSDPIAPNGAVLEAEEAKAGTGIPKEDWAQVEERTRLRLDILHRTNEALQEERDQAQQALEMARVLVLEAAPQGWIVYANRSFAALTGRGEEALRGQDLLTLLFPGYDRDRGKEAIRRSLEGGVSGPILGLTVTGPGKPVKVEWWVGPVYDRRAQVKSILWVGRRVGDEGEDPEVRTEEDRQAAFAFMEAGSRPSGPERAEFHPEEDRSSRLDLKLAASFQGITEALIDLIESRDAYTAGHSKRVAELAVSLGREMGLGQEALTGLRVCALLHDVGKSVLSSDILNKAGEVSATELALIREHPTTAYHSLRRIPFPWPVAEVVAQHHEHLDGTGYPKGLKGDQIHPWARILAVADVVDAIKNHRPYRPKLGLADVKMELHEGRGVLYDAQVVDAWFATFKRDANRIMVVDDDRPILHLVLEFLGREGYAAEGFPDPREALEAFAQRPFSMVITDLTMPGMDGLTLLEELRKINPKARTVVITGFGDKDQAVRALRLGVSDFLDKPLDLQVLRRVISRVLDT